MDAGQDESNDTGLLSKENGQPGPKQWGKRLRRKNVRCESPISC